MTSHIYSLMQKKLLPVQIGLVEKSITSPDVVRVLSIIALIQYYTTS